MPQKKFADYRRRDEVLKQLGFASYRDYLQSDLWRRIRRRILDRSANACELCGKPATEVHHLIYSREVLLGFASKLRHLISVCRSCHEHGEFSCNGSKVSRSEANSRMGKPGMMICPLCSTHRARTDFENFSGTQSYQVCKSCRKKKSNRSKIRALGLLTNNP